MIKSRIYEKYIKRILDFIIAFFSCIVLSPLLLIVACMVKIKLGSPVIFKQKRPGLNEKIFTMYKFRTMTDKRDENGELLPDEQRLTKFGKWLRSTSLDELPELFNILQGTLSIVGPRPQLVKDMVFMTREQRRRHLIRPGLTGWAQVNGRNDISWEARLKYDLEYMEKLTNKTQEEIAKYLDVDKSTYNKYENGKRKFNNDVVKELAEYYNIKVSDIVD